jgi:uncharacterized protein (DUF2147 family)
MRLVAFVAVALATPAAALAASPIEGAWRTQGGRGVVEIAPCGAQICGKVVDGPGMAANPGLTDTKNKDASKRSRPLKGLPILSGFSGGPTLWKGGTIYNPEDGGTYRSTLQLAGPDTLKVKGCVGPICRTQTWTRAK